MEPEPPTAGPRSSWTVAGISFVIAMVAGFVLRWVIARMGWIGDLVALAYPLISIASVMVASVLLHFRFIRQFAAWLALGCTCLMATVAPRLHESTSPPIHPMRIEAVNLRYDNTSMEAAVRDATASQPDVLVVSELTKRADALLTAQFPYHVTNDLDRRSFGQGVYSTVPITLLPWSESVHVENALRIRVESTDPFLLYALHLPHPSLTTPDRPDMTSFANHRQIALTIDRLVSRETEPTVIAGDLNLSDRTSGYAALVDGRRDAVNDGWLGATFIGDSFFWKVLSLQIDHIIIPETWCDRDGTDFALTGSDHRGVRSSVGSCPP
jgi:endonuclease/exonuclease/phosphatase (EEP) superfamily protein YafD